MTEQELDQHHADLQQLDIEQLRCGVMLQLHTIESLTADRDHWQAQHKECTRCLGEALQEATDVGAENDKMSDWWSQMKAERDALKDAARFALDALEGLFGPLHISTGVGGGGVAVWRLGGSDQPRKAMNALKAVL